MRGTGFGAAFVFRRRHRVVCLKPVHNAPSDVRGPVALQVTPRLARSIQHFRAGSTLSATRLMQQLKSPS